MTTFHLTLKMTTTQVVETSSPPTVFLKTTLTWKIMQDYTSYWCCAISKLSVNEVIGKFFSKTLLHAQENSTILYKNWLRQTCYFHLITHLIFIGRTHDVEKQVNVTSIDTRHTIQHDNLSCKWKSIMWCIERIKELNLFVVRSHMRKAYDLISTDEGNWIVGKNFSLCRCITQPCTDESLSSFTKNGVVIQVIYQSLAPTKG